MNKIDVILTLCIFVIFIIGFLVAYKNKSNDDKKSIRIAIGIVLCSTMIPNIGYIEHNHIESYFGLPLGYITQYYHLVNDGGKYIAFPFVHIIDGKPIFSLNAININILTFIISISITYCIVKYIIVQFRTNKLRERLGFGSLSIVILMIGFVFSFSFGKFCLGDIVIQYFNLKVLIY